MIEHTYAVMVAGAIVIIYVAWKNGYLKSKTTESYQQIPGNVFSNLEKIQYQQSDAVTLLGKKERFDQTQPLNGNELADGGDANITEYIMRQGLDRETIDSHKQYVDDISLLATLGPNKNTVRDDYRPTVQFHGLPRSRPAETIPLDDARQTNSEPASHMAEYAVRDVSFKI